MNKKATYYWDSNVFIDLIQRNPEHVIILEQIMEEAKADRIRIVSSACTLAEVVKPPNGDRLPDVDESILDGLFENDYISLRAVDRLVGTKARELVRYHNLKPVDAIHVATAILEGVNVLHTYDEEHLLKKNGRIGTPPLKIERPQGTVQVKMVI
ncbi:MAG: type II toxin-antitoxin system VapC family toxin [Bacillota bacterium]